MSQSGDYDAIVVGGGPAGSAAATLLAQAGRRVALLERETFPRFRIGESLMPATYWTFRRLGVLDEMRSSPFVRKHSVQFFSKNGRGTMPFYFSEVDPGDSAVTWQVERSRFDRMLLDHAADSGVAVHQPVNVTDAVFRGERVEGVRASFADGSRREIRAPVTVDATGQTSLISRRLGLRRTDPKLRHAAYFTRYRGAARDEGIDEGATLIFHTREQDSWFWYIPLPDDVVSVGVVGHIDYLLKGRASDPGRVYGEELAKCDALKPRLRDAERITPVQVLRDFSYSSRAIAGDGWILAGDAFGFLDPIYSSGVFLALKSAEFAADSVDEALSAGDTSASRLGRRGPEYVDGMEAIRRLVYAYYDKDFSFARFLERFPECRESLVNLLIGNVFRKDCSDLLARMDGFARPGGYEPLRLTADLA